MRPDLRSYVHGFAFVLTLLAVSLPGCDALCNRVGSECSEDADCSTWLICELGVCTDPCYVTCDSSIHGNCMPNPASIYCHRLGGSSRAETNEHGQYTICILPDGTEREQWELYCTNCPAVNICGWWPDSSQDD